MNDYPTLNFLMEHARSLALAAALIPALGAAAAVLSGASLLWIAAGLAGGIAGYGLVRSYVELIRLVTDMLLPK